MCKIMISEGSIRGLKCCLMIDDQFKIHLFTVQDIERGCGCGSGYKKYYWGPLKVYVCRGKREGLDPKDAPSDNLISLWMFRLVDLRATTLLEIKENNLGNNFGLKEIIYHLNVPSRVIINQLPADIALSQLAPVAVKVGRGVADSVGFALRELSLRQSDRCDHILHAGRSRRRRLGLLLAKTSHSRISQGK